MYQHLLLNILYLYDICLHLDCVLVSEDKN